MKFSKKVYLEWYRSILLQRRFEEKAAQLYGQQKIKGFCHLYIGQEAITAGMMSAIKKGDKVITAYRDHGHALAMGVPANAVMAELFGKETGCTGGKGGSMHMFSKEHNFVGGTSVERTTNLLDIYKIGLGFDMPSFQVDGMKCETVHEAIADACEHARTGKGPVFLEIKTYRYRGHSMSDPASYRSKEEVADYKTKDPLETTKETILKKKFASEKELDAMEDDIMTLVNASVEFAENSDYPDASELFTDVYIENDYPYITD